ncbi:cyclic-phosphate processing receiver domain-containing protein [Paenibacillus hexagrammi]|uniref:Cell division protein FtsJ n=1 Tax=Paenibacillus hexagrammi TaxID=2908839 RepID=A0ABY3SPI1_9BACL|nr:cyclic-phosphate processing receiver domain-containing protein [Paenibacillus sp. YPD9-1]UJF35963.1 cell division protein FtsJ [Paenibacillus sp. YPD9-1]
MIHVYLDDWRSSPLGFALAKNASECILMLEECEVDILSLDHDLGYRVQETGMDVVHWIIRTGRFPRRIYIHTSSPSAGSNMYQMLYSSKPEHVEVHPTKIPEDLLEQIAIQHRLGAS